MLWTSKTPAPPRDLFIDCSKALEVIGRCCWKFAHLLTDRDPMILNHSKFTDSWAESNAAAVKPRKLMNDRPNGDKYGENTSRLFAANPLGRVRPSRRSTESETYSKLICEVADKILICHKYRIISFAQHPCTWEGEESYNESYGLLALQLNIHTGVKCQVRVASEKIWQYEACQQKSSGKWMYAIDLKQ